MPKLITLLLLLLPFCAIEAQTTASGDTALLQPLKSPDKYIDAVSDKARDIERKLNKKSAKALAQLKKQEEKIFNKIAKADSILGKQLKEQAAARYKELEEKLKNPGKLQQYIPQLDSLGTSLNFLTQNSQLLTNTKEIKNKLKGAVDKVDALKAQLQKAENLKQFLKERKEFLKQHVEKFGLVKQLKSINKQVYYYSQQIAEYKAILQDPKKIEKKALEILAKQKFFQDFMRKNSMLASLFHMPSADMANSVASGGFAGLQTRVQLTSFISNNLAGSARALSNPIQQNISNAQGVAEGMRTQINKYLQSGDTEMPNFKINNQKTKSFKDRLVLGTDFQSKKSNSFFPTTSDIGLSIGYKLSDSKIVGIGTSMKVGWGKGFDNIKVTGEGFSLRSFLDLKWKGNLFVSGGFEYNYQSTFTISTIQPITDWKKSGLIGLKKTIQQKGLKKGSFRVSLLYDFFARQVPVSTPFLIRFGWSK
jgi:hypothetical protein